MKEIRITFRSEDFAAVSQALLDIGVGFRVEPVEEPPADAAPAREAPPTLKRRAAKTARKAAKPASRGPLPLTGADRLRRALTRKPPDLAPSAPPADADLAHRSPASENGM